MGAPTSGRLFSRQASPASVGASVGPVTPLGDAGATDNMDAEASDILQQRLQEMANTQEQIVDRKRKKQKPQQIDMEAGRNRGGETHRMCDVSMTRGSR